MIRSEKQSTAIGLGYRHVFSSWVDTEPAEIECLEITANHFFEDTLERVEQLTRSYPLMVHALGCSVGTPGKIDANVLRHLKNIIAVANPLWLSDHIGFIRTDDGELNHFCPVIPNHTNVDIIADHVKELSDLYGIPFLLENITSHIQVNGPLTDADFLNQICERSGCSLLLDVTNLYVNSQNHGFDPITWLHGIDPRFIKQLHVVGYTYNNNLYFDSHSTKIDLTLWELIRKVASYTSVEAITIERDSNFPPPQELISELIQLKQIFS